MDQTCRGIINDTLVVALQAFVQAPGDAVSAIGGKLFTTVERGAESGVCVVNKVLATVSVGTLVEAFFGAAKYKYLPIES